MRPLVSLLTELKNRGVQDILIAAVARDLKAIYRAPPLEAAEEELEALGAQWDSRFPQISRILRAHWANLTPFFDDPPEIRKEIYTANAAESINAQLRKVTKHRGPFLPPTP
jgi:transposase-like protein